ncbi:hypothetical protein BGZ60DRAFT_530772 [Tricladium varicosporioides]|nr:hypothetical protein BGZ60DRAFT_530772 [Hymenoscyphus varicosporioides]
MPANGKSNGRFELPQLTPVNFSLTEGTDIPPPPDSPIEEKPPPPAAKEKPATLPLSTTTVSANGRAVTPNTVANGNANGNVVHDGTGRGRTSSTDVAPLSPASTTATRPSSIRRFLSRKSLNQNFMDSSNHNGRSQEDLAGGARPESAMSFNTTGSRPLKAKRSSSWFGRLSNKRQSVVYEQDDDVKKEPRRGPPPPKLPELNQLKARIPEDDEGSLGAEDMFKNIK